MIQTPKIRKKTLTLTLSLIPKTQNSMTPNQTQTLILKIRPKTLPRSRFLQLG
jgi:hypothetical protein